jgi:hypothetical protein
VSRDFRPGPLSGTSYAGPALDTTHMRVAGSPTECASNSGDWGGPETGGALFAVGSNQMRSCNTHVIAASSLIFHLQHTLSRN